jgi:hypothetical protein
VPVFALPLYVLFSGRAKECDGRVGKRWTRGINGVEGEKEARFLFKEI